MQAPSRPKLRTYPEQALQVTSPQEARFQGHLPKMRQTAHENIYA